MGEAVGEFFVFGNKGFAARSISECPVERARECSAVEHLFHGACGNFGEFVFYHGKDVFPEFAGCAFSAHAENREVFGPVDDGVLGIAGGCSKECREAFRIKVTKILARNGLERRNFEFHDGDVRVWAFLDVHEPDFDGSAVKARDGPAAVQEKMVQKVLGVVGSNGLLDLVEDLPVVFVVGVCLFGNH